MAGYIETSLGPLYEDQNVLTTNPGFIRGEEFETCSVTCGSDVYRMVHVNQYGAEVTVYKNGTVNASPYVGFGYSKVGIAVRVVMGVATFYYVCADDMEHLPTVIVENAAGTQYGYNALTIDSYTWEDIAIVEPEGGNWEDNFDPDYDPSMNQGGANAETYTDWVNDAIDFGNIDLPTDPMESLATHTHVRMMQPYLLSAAQYITMGKIFWLDADQGTSFYHRLLNLLTTGVQDPMAAIAGLIRLPLTTGAVSVSGSGTVHLGSLPVEGGGQTLTGSYITNRWCKLSYSVRVPEVFGTDYDYTQCSVTLYCPYVGQTSLPAAQIMNKTITVGYVIDVYTGDLTCTITLHGSQHGRTFWGIVQRMKGNCALQMFYSRGDTQANTQNVFNGMLSGLGAAAEGDALGTFGAIGRNWMQQEVKTQRGGSMSGASGWLDIQYPYLVLTRNVPLYANDWRAIEGAQQHATFNPGSLTGFTKYREVHVEIPGATPEEISQIENTLKSGIIL